MNCVFCQIIKKEIPGLVVYEDENVISIIPKEMELYGHILVFPKKHYVDLFEMPKEYLQQVLDITQKLSLHLKKTLNATGINILHASGKDAGQSIGHFHLHIFPRYPNDQIDAWPKLPKNNFDRNEVLKKITFMD